MWARRAAITAGAIAVVVLPAFLAVTAAAFRRLPDPEHRSTRIFNVVLTFTVPSTHPPGEFDLVLRCGGGYLPGPMRDQVARDVTETLRPLVDIPFLEVLVAAWRRHHAVHEAAQTGSPEDATSYSPAIRSPRPTTRTSNSCPPA